MEVKQHYTSLVKSLGAVTRSAKSLELGSKLDRYKECDCKRLAAV